MKSFAKAFRAVLSIALVLCMVMSFVTVSADATDVTVTAKSNPSRLDDGYYSVTYEVSNITAADADATIMVYSGDSISKETIKYANQKDAVEGKAEFTMEVPAGVYNVVAGGTGATAGSSTFTANTAPAFDAETATASKDDTEVNAAGVVVMAAPVATDVDAGQTVEYSLSEDANFELNGGNIVTKGAVEAGVYNLTLTATDGIATDTIAIAITVNKSDVVVTITAYADVTETVGYNAAYVLPATVKATVTGYIATEIDVPVTWDPASIDTTESGVKTAVGTVGDPAEVDGYEFVKDSGLANTVTATITVNEKPVVNVKVTEYKGFEDKALVSGEGYELPGKVTAVLDGYTTDEVELGVVWTCDVENYDLTKVGTYVFTGAVAEMNEAGYSFEVVAEAPTFKVTVSPKVVTIDKFVFEPSAVEAYTGVAFADLGLATEAKAYVGEEEVAKFAIEWNEEDYNRESTEAQTITGEVIVVDTTEIDYAFDGELNKVATTVTLSVQVFDIEAIDAIPAKYVSTSDSYAGDVYDKLPATVWVSYNSGVKAEVGVEWPVEADVPGEGGDTTTIEGTLVNLPANLTNNGGLKASLDITTYYNEFTFKTNGENVEGLVAVIGKPIEIAVDYNDLGQGAKYAYAVAKAGEEVVAPGEEAYGDSATMNVTIESEVDVQWIVYVYVKVGNYTLVPQQVAVLMSSTTFGGHAYVNATANNPKYSAFRVNKAAGFTVSNDFRNFNDAAYDFSAGEFKYTITKDGAFVTENTTGIFSAEDIAALSGAYRVDVTYSENGTVLHKAGRTVNISNIALWYSEMTINGKPGSGIIVNKNKDLVHKFVLDGLGADGKAYAGSELIAGHLADPSASAVLEEITSPTVKNTLVVKENNSGTYTLYALAKLTNEQSFYDLAVGRTVYLENSISTICNVKLNGSNNCVPENIANGLKIAPHKGNPNENIDGVTYALKFYKFDGTDYVELPEYEVESFTSEYTLDNTDAFAFKNKVVLTVNIKGEFDKEIEKVFYAVR